MLGVARLIAHDRVPLAERAAAGVLAAEPDRHAAGVSIRAAALEAAQIRFRAVLMTAFSFILGVIPLLIATGAGAESRQAMGTTVFGGMLVATIVSLLAVPMLYMVVQSISEKFRGVKPVEGEDHVA